MLKDNERRGLCGICPAGCWVIVRYDEEGKLDTVRADETSHLGTICRLGERSREIVYSEHRLKTPLRRTGPKGTYEFEPVSWDEAYKEIVERLQTIKSESGPEATAIYTGRGSFDLALCDVFQPEDVAISSASSVLFPFGSPNTLGVGALCYVSFAMIAPHVTMGGMLMNMFSDLEHADLIVVWGANPATDCPPLDLHRIVQASQRGAEIVVIDPRRTKTATLTGGRWIGIRPGTDGALALGLCNVLIEEELYDDKFVEQWTLGFEEFARYVQHFRPEEVERITGVPADTVVSLAHRIAEAQGASPVMYTGLEYSDSGVQAIRATFTLWALAGQLDVPGGRCFTMSENQFRVNRDGLIPNPDVRKALGRDRFPVYSQYRGESHAIALPESVLKEKPYRIRSLIILGGSMITSWPQPSIWKETLEKLDFLVTIDRQLTADSAYADIVLPATTQYEIDSYMTYGPLFRIREKIIEPVGEARNDFFILAELAERLGYGHLYPQTEDELLEYVLKGSQFSPDDIRAAGGTVSVPTVMMEYRKWEKGLLRADGQPGFETPSGKFEIASTILEDHGYAPLPEYTEPRESPLSRPDLAQKYPLIFNSGARVTTDFRSQHHGVPSLRRERPEPTVTINREDANERGIEHGDLVLISSPRGQVHLRALVTDDIIPGAVDANMGGGGPIGPQAWQDCNINELTDLAKYDPVSGFPTYKSLLCDVKKVSGQRETVTIDSGEYNLPAASPEIENKHTQNRIYFDNNATTSLDPVVAKEMIRFMQEEFGNPSSIYSEGISAKFAIESARRKIGQLLNCQSRRVIFTGGGSEANNLAIKGTVFGLPKNKNHIITSSIEHPSVLKTCQWLETRGYDVSFIPVDRFGIIDTNLVADEITERTGFITIMLANNETGTLQPVTEIAALAHERDIILHSDAVQAVGKIAVDVIELDVDMLTLSGHKFYGPKGVGCLFCKKGISLQPLIHGGKQENGLRAGTENLASIVGLGRAAELAQQRLPQATAMAELRDRLYEGITDIVHETRLNGHREKRLPNTLNVVLPGFRGESLVLALDQKGVALSSGSACRAGSPDPSHAILALGLSEEDAHCSIRLSLGLSTSRKEVDTFLEHLATVIKESRTTVRFVPCR